MRREGKREMGAALAGALLVVVFVVIMAGCGPGPQWLTVTSGELCDDPEYLVGANPGNCPQGDGGGGGVDGKGPSPAGVAGAAGEGRSTGPEGLPNF